MVVIIAINSESFLRVRMFDALSHLVLLPLLLTPLD